MDAKWNDGRLKAKQKNNSIYGLGVAVAKTKTNWKCARRSSRKPEMKMHSEIDKFCDGISYGFLLISFSHAQNYVAKHLIRTYRSGQLHISPITLEDYPWELLHRFTQILFKSKLHGNAEKMKAKRDCTIKKRGPDKLIAKRLKQVFVCILTGIIDCVTHKPQFPSPQSRVVTLKCYKLLFLPHDDHINSLYFTYRFLSLLLSNTHWTGGYKKYVGSLFFRSYGQNF